MSTPQPPDPRYSSGTFPPGNSLGRDVRLFTGMLAIFGDGVLLYMEHVHATPPAAYTTPDIIMHIAILVMGIFLMDARRTLELVSAVKDKLPFGGK